MASLAVAAQQGGESRVSLVRTSDNTFRLTFSAYDCQPSVVNSANEEFCQLRWDGMALGNGRVGSPDLPSLSTLVSLPKGSALEVKDIETDGSSGVKVLPDGKCLAPVTEGWVKDGPQPVYRIDEKIYGTNEPYRGGERVEVENLGAMGVEQLFRVTVRPVYYQPEEGKLFYESYLEATLQVSETAPLPASNRFLVVSRPQFREGLQPFVRWKRQEGYDVTELYVDTHKRDSIKAMIGDRAPRYMLLVGDVAQIQSFLGTTHPSGLGNHVTDLYYAEFTGDYLPDAFVGRWPVNDTAELGAVVRKTLAYEQFFDVDTTHLTRVLLVAGAESQEPAPVTTNGQVNYVRREVRQVNPSMDTLCYYNPASDNQRGAILDDLRQGAAWLNYTAHCTSAGWTRPSVTFSSIDTLDSHQPLIYVNNCCLSNAFDGTCFGEQLLRKADGGAIGVIGATNSTLWNEDYYWAVGPKYPFSLNPLYEADRPGAFDCWVGQKGGVQTLGELLTAGNLAVTAFGSPYDKFYWETYCLLGDPTLRPWVGIPQTINLHVAGPLFDGAGSVSITGIPGVTVTLMQHDTVLGSGTIGVDGSLTLYLNYSLDTSLLVLTASGTGFRPHVDTLEVETVVGMGVALRGVEVEDTQIRCRVENVGTVPLFDLQVVLSQLDADSTIETLVEEQLSLIDTLLPHQCRQVVLPVEVTEIGQLPQWRAQLFAWDSTEGILCHLELSHEMEVVYPTATFRLLETDSREAHSLLPSHEYLLETSVEGVFDSVEVTVTTLPSTDTLATSSASLSAFSLPLSTLEGMTHLRLEASLTLGNHHAGYDYYLVGGPRMESFEEGFTSYPWHQGGTRPWQLDSTMSHSGRFCARSGAIDYRQTSDLCLDVLLPQRDTLSFWASTSCESNYDKMVLLVDGKVQGNEMWGIRGWRRYSVVLASGEHTLCWRYVKDESGSEGEDCAWIDDVRLPLALWTSPYGWFGSPSTEGIAPIASKSDNLRIFPNPSDGMVTVEGSADGMLQVFDLYGRIIYSTYHTSPSVHRLTFLPDGLYLLRVVTATGSIHQTLVIHH